MRRILLSSFGIVLGAFAQSASGQDAARPLPDPINRAAGLGRPVAVGDSGEVTPAGLTARGQIPPPGQPMATYPSTPIVTGPMTYAPAPGAPTSQPPPGAAPRPGLMPTPRTVTGGPPMVTEVRDPAAGLGAPYTVPGNGYAVNPAPYGAPGAPVLVPPIGPATGGGFPPQPCLDDPIYGGDCAPGAPAVGGVAGLPAINRLFGVTASNKWYASAEYLLWWTRSSQLPTLVTTSMPQYGGIVGAGDTRPVIGGGLVDTLHSGTRVGVGYWFGDDQRRGIDARFMFLFRNGAEYSANTGTYPLLARPFINANTPVGSFSEIVGAPGLADAGVIVKVSNALWGADVNYRRSIAASPCGRLDGLIGYRFLNLKDDLTITESFVRTPNSPLNVGVPATFGRITDSFRTENSFHGGQVGLVGEVRRGRWSLDGRATIAFGTVFQTVDINGSQQLAFPNGGYQQTAGGLQAVPGTNIGSFHQNRFAVLPEAGFNIGYQATSHLRVFVGYNFLYLSSVVRPGDVIDPVIDAARVPNFPLPGNPAPIAGLNRPAPILRTSDFWAQGISFGLQFTW